MLDMEYVGRVMRPEMMRNICQNARTLITGGLHDLTVQCGQGRCHEVIPGRLISGLSQLFQNNEVAHGLYAHHTETSGTRFVLGAADIFAGHVLGQPGSFRVALGADRFFHLAVHLLLSPRRGGHKPIQTGEVEQEADEANPTSPDVNADQVEGENEPMQESQSGAILKELGHMRTDIERVVPPAPGLECGAGNLKLFGGLTLGETLSLQLEITQRPVRPLETILSRRVLDIVEVGKIDDRAHVSLSLKSLPYK